MAWEIVEEIMIGSTKYTWTFPSELKSIILSEIEYQGNPNFSVEITSQIPNHSMHDWTIVDYPFTFHKGSDGNWQGGTSYTIGLGTYSIPSRDTDGVYYELTNNHRAGVNYINNTNGTMVVFFAINESTHQAAIMYLLSAWYLSGDMNRIHLVGSGTNTTDYEQLYSDLLSAIPSPSNYTSNGGGATHIAKRTGQLKDLSSYTSDILIVSGGGGGGLLVGETDYSGKEAGGISGSGDNSADQSTGNAFGQGESGTDVSGGGSGLYGGYKGTSSKSGGAGSGYIGNSLLSNKKMVGYNVPTSSAEGTKTESVEVFDSNYVANKPKAGNGHVRIRLLSEQQTKSFFNVVSSYDLTNVGSGITADSIDYSDYLGQIVFYGQSNRKLLSINDGVFNYTSALSYTQSNLAFPLKDYPIRITKVTCKVTLKELRGENSWVDLKIICNSGLIGRARYAYTDSDPRNINLNEETSFIFDVSSSNMQATHIDFQFSYGIWEVKEIMVSYV